MGMEMRQLLYVSNTSRTIAPSLLNDILTASRRNNQALDVTGLLLHIDGGFLQVLEGEELALSTLYARIRADKRHWNTQLLLDHQSERAFGEWSMGFERLDGQDPETAGMFGVTQEAIAGRLSPTAGKVVITMLRTFYRVQCQTMDLFKIA
jgi:hypothetical protein